MSLARDVAPEADGALPCGTFHLVRRVLLLDAGIQWIGSSGLKPNTAASSATKGGRQYRAWPVRVKNYLFRKGAGRRDRSALSRLRRAARQRRIPAERRPALSRHGPHRVCVARMPPSARRRHLRSSPAINCSNPRSRTGRRRIAFRSSRTMSTITPARPSAATRII